MVCQNTCQNCVLRRGSLEESNFEWFPTKHIGLGLYSQSTSNLPTTQILGYHPILGGFPRRCKDTPFLSLFNDSIDVLTWFPISSWFKSHVQLIESSIKKLSSPILPYFLHLSLIFNGFFHMIQAEHFPPLHGPGHFHWFAGPGEGGFPTVKLKA